MRKLISLFEAGVVVVLLFGCGLFLGPEKPGGQPPIDINEKTGKLLQLASDAITTGDRTALDDYLSAEDPSGALRLIVDSKGAFERPTAMSKASSMAPAPTTTQLTSSEWPELQEGDIILLGPGANWASQLMSYVFVFGYGHSGVYARPGSDFPVLSATIALDENYSVVTNGVCFQSLDELYYGSNSIAVIHPGVSLPAGWIETCGYGDRDLGYAFLKLNLDPIGRYDPFWWYCSKIVWRVYHDYAGVDVENYSNGVTTTQFYARDGGPFLAQKSSLLYGVYSYYYWNILNGFWRKFVDDPDTKLAKVLKELISPDEIRYHFRDLKGPPALYLCGTSTEGESRFWGLLGSL